MAKPTTRPRFQPKRRRDLPEGAKPAAAERVGKILAALDQEYPVVECALDHTRPLELLVATILSAQCTDERVNIVTRDLFPRYPTPAHYADADPAELEAVIHSTGFFRNKSKNLIGMGRGLIERYDGEVPRTMDDLLSLPGVARKTANVVLGTAFQIAVGVVVDTHVGRIAQRLGLTKHEDPVRIEQDLIRLVPQDHWIRLSHQLIWHGRRVCTARKPACERCTLATWCPSAGVAA
ncbi:MAG: endonuclease III [Candidatus Eisenbacteria bacterium]|nr:endonuclease III [Candidatus Eisenbacteria bacterium]